VILAVPLTPSLVAVTAVVPAPTPVTRPVLETVATAPFALDHEMARPVNTFPFASFVTAASCTVAPVRMLDDEGETVTDATGTGGAAVTVSAAWPVWPSLDAMI